MSRIMKKINDRFLGIFPLLALVLFRSGQYALAGESAEQSFNNSLEATAKKTGHADVSKSLGTDLPDMIGNVIQWILSFMGVIFLVLLIYGGFKWFMARGNDSEVQKATEIIKNAVTGIVIIVAAYAITVFVGSIITT